MPGNSVSGGKKYEIPVRNIFSLFLAGAAFSAGCSFRAGRSGLGFAISEKDLGIRGGGRWRYGSWQIGWHPIYRMPEARIGFILTHDHLPGLLHGNFEWAVDVIPLYAVLPPASAIYGGSVRPLIWQWNFTSWRKYAPYVAIVGGMVFTTSYVPPEGNTSIVNFTRQAVPEHVLFVKPRRAVFSKPLLAICPMPASAATIPDTT